MKLALLIILAATIPVFASQLSSGQGSATMQSPHNPATQLDGQDLQRITGEVRHQLVLLPYYGVFDNLAYRVSGDGTVTLEGQVTRPTLKSDAENVVKKIEGVDRVDNQIQVLPPSPADERIRMATYRAIYGNDVLSSYALCAVPPIHIIVNNGNVTLEGVVNRSMDKQVADTQAKSVPGVFSVTDHLRVEQPEQ